MPHSTSDASSRAEWERRLTPSERAAQIAGYERLVTCDVRVAFALTLLWCGVWLLAGLALIGWALHTADPELGEIGFLGGLLVGYSGMMVTLARYYLRGERAGWW